MADVEKIKKNRKKKIREQVLKKKRIMKYKDRNLMQNSIHLLVHFFLIDSKTNGLILMKLGIWNALN